jgi:hypothetical protein
VKSEQNIRLAVQHHQHVNNQVKVKNGAKQNEKRIQHN